MRLIDADSLRERMYHEAFETDSDMQKWESGCWIRYKMFENAIASEPTIDAVPRKAFDGILWENDMMRKQLVDIGKSFGEKMDDVVKVVRCRDCKVKNEERCPWWHGVPADEFYCAWGEREDDG